MDKRAWVLFPVVFVDLLGFGVLIPIFPLLVQDYGGNPFVVGALIATYSVFQFIFSPILGRLSDKYGRKPVLVVSTVVNALSYLLIYFSQNIWLLFISRIIGGIGGANISVVQAYIADISESHERTKLMALFGAFFAIGFVIGPFVGGVLSGKFSIQAPFLATFIMSLVSGLFVLFFVGESNKMLQRNVKIEFFNLKLTREILKPRNMSFLLFLFFLVNFSLSLIQGVFPLFSSKVLSWNEENNGYYFAMLGTISFLNQSLGIRFLLRRMNESTIIRYGLVSLGAGYLLIGFSQTVYLVIMGGALIAFGFSLVFPSTQSLISLESKREQQGVVMGVSQSFGSLARVLGPLLGGALATYKINFPYIIGGIAILLIFLWGRGHLKMFKRKQ